MVTSKKQDFRRKKSNIFSFFEGASFFFGFLLLYPTPVSYTHLFWQHYQKDRAAFEKKKQAEKAAQPEEKKPDDTGNDTW